MTPRIVPAATALCLSLLLCDAARAGDGFTVGTGVDYSSGKYGSDTTTDILAVPVTASWTHGKFSARVSVPWLRVSGDPNVLPGVGGVDNTNPLGRGRLPLIGDIGQPPADENETPRGTASGIGDVSTALTWSLPLGKQAGIDLGVNAKFATADEDKGLGTGANDYGASIDLYRDFDGTLLFGGVGRTRLGDSRYIDLDEVDNASLGLGQKVGNGRIGAMYEYRSSASSGRDDRRDAMLFYSRPNARGGRVQFYASHGFTDGGPEWGAGVAISTGF
jgi:hypothetical protein